MILGLEEAAPKPIGNPLGSGSGKGTGSAAVWLAVAQLIIMLECAHAFVVNPSA